MTERETTQTVEIQIDPLVAEALERMSRNLERVAGLLQENVALLKQVLERPADFVGGPLRVS
jgi:hypothetical protein